MPWGAVAGAAIGVAGEYLNQPDAPQLAPQSATETWQGYMAPQYYQTVANQAAQPYSPYGGQGVAPMNATQQAVGQSMMNGVSNPYFGMDNPYLDQQIAGVTSDMQTNFNNTTVPMLAQQDQMANTGFGWSSAADQMESTAYQGLNDQMAQVSNDMRMDDYKMQAQMGEQDAARDMQMMQMQMGYGNQQQATSQAQNTFDYNQYLAAMQYPQQQINMMGAAMGMPSQSPTYAPGTVSPDYLNSAMGGAAAGQAAYNMYQTPPTQPQQGGPSTYNPDSDYWNF